ncbi:hypothetical protein D3C81_2202120 [compost metagenome]
MACWFTIIQWVLPKFLGQYDMTILKWSGFLWLERCWKRNMNLYGFSWTLMGSSLPMKGIGILGCLKQVI